MYGTGNKKMLNMLILEMKSDFDGAVKFLAKMAVQIVGDDNIDKAKERAKKCLSKAAAHPSVVGLIFSVTSQFTKKDYKFENDTLTVSDLHFA